MENRRTPRMILVFVVMCFALGAIVTYSQMSSQPLQGYVEEHNSILTTVAPYTAPEVNLPMQEVVDEDIGLRMQAPEKWVRIIKDGCVTYIDQATATYMQIQKLDYTPNQYSITEAEIQSDLASEGLGFVSFSRDSYCGYTVMYQQYVNDMLYDLIEIVRMDRQRTVKIQICALDGNYKSLEKEIALTAGSVVWNPKDPIPEDFLLAYSEFGHFEFAVPISWERGLENGEYVARDTFTGAEMHVTAYASDSMYTDITAETYASYLSPGKPDLQVLEFSCSPNILYAVSGYTAGDVPVYRVEYMLATGNYEYNLSFICPVSEYSQMAEMFRRSVELFRTF